MKKLQDILFGSRVKKITGNPHLAIESLHEDSRSVKKSSLFVAIDGTQVDGHKFIASAIEKGAAAIVLEQGRLPNDIDDNVCYVEVENTSESLGYIASNFYDNPSEKLKLVGITGTNGKTTVATLCFELFKSLGYPVGLVSTIQNKINNQIIDATHTTPNAIALNALLQQMVQAGCEFCFMEVSSHAVHQNRVAGVKFTGGVFTNISRDHLDYHKTFNEYIKAKKKFFDDLPSSAFALSNADDANGEVMLQNTVANKLYYAMKRPADFKVKVLENAFHGMRLELNNQDFHTPLVGSFNAYNLNAVFGIASLLGQDKEQVLMAMSLLKPVNGRFQHYTNERGAVVVVDYAHTPDALENVLKTIGQIRGGNEKLITVVGCGGNRDKGKRPEMAKVAVTYSDKTIFTSDNPRNENPDDIIDDMKAGVSGEYFMKYTTQRDRMEAIKQALLEAQASDIVLIAGKGHENYQEINGERHHFDDLETAINLSKLIN